MSRSFRKPYEAMSYYSPLGMRQYKQGRVRQERARVRNAIAQGNYDLAEIELAPWNDWDCPLDGKMEYRDDERLMRK